MMSKDNSTGHSSSKNPDTHFLELSVPSLSGIVLGDRLDALDLFGGAAKALKQHGVGFRTDGSTIRGISIFYYSLVDRLNDVFGPKSFKGRILFDGKECDISPDNIKKLLGQEIEQWNDEVAHSMRFIRNGVLIEFIFNSKNSALKEINLEATE